MEVMKIRLFCHKDQRFVTLTALCLVLFALSGCAVVSPRSISMGRSDYNKAKKEGLNE